MISCKNTLKNGFSSGHNMEMLRGLHEEAEVAGKGEKSILIS